MELITIFCLSLQLVFISRIYEMIKDWMEKDHKRDEKG
jgi:hypothetical protein